MSTLFQIVNLLVLLGGLIVVVYTIYALFNIRRSTKNIEETVSEIKRKLDNR